MSEQFEMRTGIPHVVGAIDGSLFPIKRLEDWDGWYCRKGFPARCHQIIPRGSFLVADTGYQLFAHVSTPYPITSSMPPDERKYNYRHIGTRIVVEMAFGRLKNMFRIFQTPLLHDTPKKMAQIIKCSLVLHNWLIYVGSELA
ncbi:TPA: hypothetical protein N0F65_002759 [Lagenidium giganteum]|uniref:DDE Tnp4 domain-containing protein n=1 Tax=Lagenidium giganteum TaxID=4803 RepID=A0AAV2YK02_9STRA|nr:TPA: hypothetical protein N0F65_002759 [Lagenidium giganteum]